MDHPALQDPKIKAILAQPYGRFSDAEFARRRQGLADVSARCGCDAILLCGEQRTGTGVGWLTGWPASARAFVIFQPSERDLLFVEHVNHVPNARQIAKDAEVHWAELRGAQAVAEEMARRGIKRVGVIGVLTWLSAKQLGAFDLVDLTEDYRWLRMRKSDEEIDWMRIGAAFSDLGLAALLIEGKPGMTERELGTLVERDYHALGGSTVIHFIGRNKMMRPTCCVPPQHHSSAKLETGDMLFIEFSATFWDYPGQVLRTIAVGAEPAPVFRDLHSVAEAAFDAITDKLKAGVSAQELFDATSLIEDAGYSTYDDIVHGFGGGYWPPVLGTKSHPSGPIPDINLEANMTIVVQPNVITTDLKAGVQLGEMLLITETGFERLHAAPWGLLRMK